MSKSVRKGAFISACMYSVHVFACMYLRACVPEYARACACVHSGMFTHVYGNCVFAHAYVCVCLRGCNVPHTGKYRISFLSAYVFFFFLFAGNYGHDRQIKPLLL